MSKTSIVLIIYILGLIFGALVLGIWSAETSVYKGLLGLGWTALALIGLFFAEKMKIIKTFIIFFFVILPINILKSEIIVMSKCDDKQDEFLKNEYILNLNERIMTRNYVYKEKTFQKYRLTDLSVKKSNSYVQNIYEEDGKILTHKHGYPQFYTQILFEKDKKEIFMRTVLNDEEGLSKISTCKKIEKFEKES